MSALVAVRHDQDWVGFAVVIFGVGGLSFLAWLDVRHDIARRAGVALDRALDRLPAMTRITVRNRPEVDHVECSNPDCDQTVCRCRMSGECTGFSTLGCPHGEGLCWTCRLGCRECKAEQDAEWDRAWAAGR